MKHKQKSNNDRKRPLMILFVIFIAGLIALIAGFLNTWGHAYLRVIKSSEIGLDAPALIMNVQ